MLQELLGTLSLLVVNTLALNNIIRHDMPDIFTRTDKTILK